PTDYYYTDWQLLVYALGLGFLINLLVVPITRMCLRKASKKQGIYIACLWILLSGHFAFALITPVYALNILLGPAVPLGPTDRRFGD
ncbi:hypothetical protein J0X19_23975, partial [Hymenobacter sp. BT186]